LTLYAGSSPSSRLLQSLSQDASLDAIGIETQGIKHWENASIVFLNNPVRDLIKEFP
jgi:hypothetical protein